MDAEREGRTGDAGDIQRARVERVKLQLSGFKDLEVALYFPGARHVAEEAIDLIDDLVNSSVAGTARARPVSPSEGLKPIAP